MSSKKRGNIYKTRSFLQLSLEAKSGRRALRDRLHLIVISDADSARLVRRDVAAYFPQWNLTLVDVDA